MRLITSLSLFLSILQHVLAFDITVPADPVYPNLSYKLIWSRSSSDPERFLVQRAIVGVSPNPSEYEDILSGGKTKGTMRLSLPSVARFQWLILDPNSRNVLWRSREFNVNPTPAGGAPQPQDPPDPTPDPTTKRPDTSPTKSPNKEQQPNETDTKTETQTVTDQGAAPTSPGQGQTPTKTDEARDSNAPQTAADSSGAKETGTADAIAGVTNNPAGTGVPPAGSTDVASGVNNTSQSSKPSVGAIAGGVIGGLIVVLVLVGLWWYQRRRRRLPPHVRLAPSPIEYHDMTPVSSPGVQSSHRVYTKAEEAQYGAGYSSASESTSPTFAQQPLVPLRPGNTNHHRTSPSSNDGHSIISSAPTVTTRTTATSSSGRTRTARSEDHQTLMTRIAALEGAVANSQAEAEGTRTELARLRAENEELRETQDPPPLYDARAAVAGA